VAGPTHPGCRLLNSSGSGSSWFAGVRVLADGVMEGGYPEVSEAGALSEVPHCFELLFGGGEGGFETSDFAEPAFPAGFGDPGLEVVLDLQEPGHLAGVWA
jgi:hypothetical protein